MLPSLIKHGNGKSSNRWLFHWMLHLWRMFQLKSTQTFCRSLVSWGPPGAARRGGATPPAKARSSQQRQRCRGYVSWGPGRAVLIIAESIQGRYDQRISLNIHQRNPSEFKLPMFSYVFISYLMYIKHGFSKAINSSCPTRVSQRDPTRKSPMVVSSRRKCLRDVCLDLFHSCSMSTGGVGASNQACVVLILHVTVMSHEFYQLKSSIHTNKMLQKS